MKESRKIWRFAVRCAQYYCVVFLVGFLLFFAAIAAQAAPASKPDPLLNPPSACAEGIVAADLTNGVDATGHPVAPAGQSQAGAALAGGIVAVPVRTPTGRRLDLPLDISGLLQPPLPACLTPEQARENMPLKPAPKR